MGRTGSAFATPRDDRAADYWNFPLLEIQIHTVASALLLCLLHELVHGRGKALQMGIDHRATIGQFLVQSTAIAPRRGAHSPNIAVG